MSFRPSNTDWSLWLWWIMVTGAGNTAGLLLLIVLATNLGLSLVPEDGGADASSLARQLSLAPTFLLSGLTIGFAQWAVLRGLFTGANRWILVTAAGWLVGFVLVSLIPIGLYDGFSTLITALLPWLIIGLIIGLGQWLLLRQLFLNVGMWVFFTAIATVLGIAGWLVGGVLGGLFSAAAGGALTGWLLVRMFR